MNREARLAPICPEPVNPCMRILGELLENLVRERDAEKQKWIDKLVHVGGDQLKQDGDRVDVNLGPIQTVFSLNLKDSLLAYQKFYDSMLKEKADL